MKKSLKITLGVIGGIILLLGVDLICIFTIKRPIFAIKKDNSSVYKGIFYDTYNCQEYALPQIKPKGTKFMCVDSKKNIGKIKEIIDTTKDIKNFNCDQTSEIFYEDNNYMYNWNCNKNKYMLVKYENGYEERVNNALKRGTITINDLDESGISYIKSPKEDNNEHSFFGKVLESHSTYIIVKPNETEVESKNSDKFFIKLPKNNDQIYNVGTNIKITYTGGIKESYPAQIDTTKIEIRKRKNFKLIFNQIPDNAKKQIIDKNTDKQYNYNVYVWNGDINIIIDNKTYSLQEALKENKITIDEIIAKLNEEIKEPIIYKDGGSIEYRCDNYTVIKFHTLDNNRDVYFGNKDLKIEDIKG